MATPGNMVCEGTNVIFKALPNNGGSNPGYQWKKNGINIGTNTNTYSSISLANGDIISCEMTVAETCPAAQSVVSNPITMQVSIPPAGTFISARPVAACVPENNVGSEYGIGPRKVILADLQVESEGNNGMDQYYIDNTLPAPPNCFPPVAHLNSGETYTLTVTVGGNLEHVRGWIDFNNDGTFQASELVMSSDGTTYNQTHTSTFTVPSSGIVTCTSLRMRIASDFALYAPPPEPCSHLLFGQTEDFIVKVKDPSSPIPSVSISASGNGTCAGGRISFTATPTNGGANPTYQWRLNGKDVGTNSNTYSSPTFVNGDLVSCVMTSSEAGTCTPTVTSNSIPVLYLSCYYPHSHDYARYYRAYLPRHDRNLFRILDQ